MKRFIALLMTIIMLLSLCACGSKDEDFHMDINFSDASQPTEWSYKASEKLAAMITEKTEGHITVTYYGRNELDCYGSSVARAANGEVWMGLEEPILFAEYVGDAAMVVAPMLYRSNAEYDYVVDSKFGSTLCAKLAKQGIRVLDTHYSSGFRSLVTNFDVTKPEDLKGRVLCTADSPMHSKILECLGAAAAPMPSLDECLLALRSGTAEGFCSTVSALSGAGSPYELVKKVAATGHLIEARWLFISETAWKQIPEKYQRIIEECAYECGMWEQISCEDDEANRIEFLKSQGVTWNDVDLDAFSAAMSPVIDWIVERYGSGYEVYDQIVTLVAEFRAKNEEF